MAHRHLRRAPRPARDLFRPHRRRGLVAADLGRAGRPHPRDGARRARRDARDAALLAAGRPRAASALLDAGCGTGALAVEAARRGAEVVADRPVADAGRPRRASALPRDLGAGRDRLPRRRHARPGARPLRPRRRDGFADPLPRRRHRPGARRRSRAHGRASVLFTFAPRTAAAGRDARRRAACSRAATARRPSSRSAEAALRGALAAEPALRRLAAAAARERIASGFYISQAMELRAAMSSGSADDSRAQWLASRSARASCPSPTRRRRSCRSAGCCGCRCSRSRSAWRSVLLIGTLNRVMIVELGVPAWLVAMMVSLPLVFAPFRALVGFRSDTHRSVLGWRRVPYIWFGTLLQFGGLAIMPFALLVLSGDTHGPAHRRADRRRRSPSCWSAPACTRRRPSASRSPPISRPEQSRPKVVALLCVDAAGRDGGERRGVRRCCSRNFSAMRLIQVIQGAALVDHGRSTWSPCGSRRPRDPARTATAPRRPTFRAVLAGLRGERHARRGASSRSASAPSAFSMQDILLEPYGGQILHLTVGRRPRR